MADGHIGFWQCSYAKTRDWWSYKKKYNVTIIVLYVVEKIIIMRGKGIGLRYISYPYAFFGGENIEKEKISLSVPCKTQGKRSNSMYITE